MGSPSTPTTTERRWLRLGPAAELLGVSANTLRRWSDAGRIACYRSAGGHRRFRRADIEALLRESGDRARPAAAANFRHSAVAIGPGRPSPIGRPSRMTTGVAIVVALERKASRAP